LAEHRQELFPDSFIVDLFCSSTGRPSLPADLIGSVLVLKELFDLSDPQTADALRYDIRSLVHHQCVGDLGWVADAPPLVCR